jgi:hypothetical protein
MVFSLLFSPDISASFHYCQPDFVLPDTLAPPPPPELPGTLSGPSSACTGDLTQYAVDVAVDCYCIWTIDGVPQPESGSPLGVAWLTAGIHQISVQLACQDGEISPPQAMEIAVFDAPAVFLGNDTTIVEGQSLLLDARNPGATYLWSTGETTRMITVSNTGTYMVNVTNLCGTDADTIEVSVIAGIDDEVSPQDCFSVFILQNQIRVMNISKDIIKIQVISADGRIVFEGSPGNEIVLDRRGTYFIKGISKKGICTRKVILP